MIPLVTWWILYISENRCMQPPQTSYTLSKSSGGITSCSITCWVIFSSQYFSLYLLVNKVPKVSTVYILCDPPMEKAITAGHHNMKPAILLGVANYLGEKLFNVLLTLSLSSKACNRFTSLITRTGDGIPYLQGVKLPAWCSWKC